MELAVHPVHLNFTMEHISNASREPTMSEQHALPAQRIRLIMVLDVFVMQGSSLRRMVLANPALLTRLIMEMCVYATQGSSISVALAQPARLTPTLTVVHVVATPVSLVPPPQPHARGP